jgi:DHA1 family bicyclomycin/chloramphenicol resistance-like MFS transporter
LLTDLLSWHAALALVMGFGALALGLVFFTFQETVHRKNPQALHVRVLAKTWWHIVRHPTFVAFTSVSTASYGGLFTFLASSSFVFIGLIGLARWQYGLLLFSMAFTYILGTLLCRRLLVRFGVDRTVAIGGTLSLIGGGWLLLDAWLGWQTLVGLMGPFYLFVLAHGIHQPCGQSGAVGPFPKAAGAASALGGFLMMVAAFATGLWLGGAKDGSALPMAQSILGAAPRRPACLKFQPSRWWDRLPPAKRQLRWPLLKSGRLKSSASILRWCIAAWTLAQPNPMPKSWHKSPTT